MSSNVNIQELKNEIKSLEEQLLEKKKILNELQISNMQNESLKYSGDLTTDEVARYSRQMLIPDLGPNGQLRLKSSKVMIVGAGGLGCPAALYLAAAGVGEITIIDSDEVEMSNLHRQVLHRESDIGKPKVLSAFEKLISLNSSINIIPVNVHINSKTIQEIMEKKKFDVAIDGTDNVATRYLLNDACVLNGVPLVSGSALQMEGQLTVYNLNGGPCYRCLYPVPPPPESVTSCGDGGVLGTVPGVIGILQALETIKILVGAQSGVLSGRLLTFDGAHTVFRNVRLRSKNTSCVVCGDNPSITSLIDYEQFCNAKAHDKVVNINILEADEMIKPKDLFNSHESEYNFSPLLIDVRSEIEFRMCHLPGSINLPYSDIIKGKNINILHEAVKKREMEKDKNVYVICRRGNDSQRAISFLKEMISSNESELKFVNITGGLHSYAQQVDNAFPVY